MCRLEICRVACSYYRLHVGVIAGRTAILQHRFLPCRPRLSHCVTSETKQAACPAYHLISVLFSVWLLPAVWKVCTAYHCVWLLWGVITFGVQYCAFGARRGTCTCVPAVSKRVPGEQLQRHAWPPFPVDCLDCVGLFRVGGTMVFVQFLLPSVLILWWFGGVGTASIPGSSSQNC